MNVINELKGTSQFESRLPIQQEQSLIADRREQSTIRITATTLLQSSIYHSARRKSKQRTLGFNNKLGKPSFLVKFASEVEIITLTQNNFRRCPDDGVANQMPTTRVPGVVAQTNVNVVSSPCIDEEWKL